MNEDKSDGTGGQESPPSANQRSLDFVYWIYGDERDHTFLAGSIPGDKKLRKVGYYSDDLLKQMPLNERHHVSAATYEPHLPGRNEDKITSVPVIVFDDIGKAAPPGTVSLSGIEIDESEFACLPDPTWTMETSKGRYQYGYGFEPPLPPDIARFIHAELKKHPILGKGLHSLGQYYRLPTGTNTKPGQNFPTRLAHLGEKISLEAFCRGFNINLTAPGVKAQAQRQAYGETLSPEKVRKLLELIPNDAKAGHRYDMWVKVGHAIYGATDGSEEGFELYDWWSSQSPFYCVTETPRQKWDSFQNAKASATTLRVLIEELFGVDSTQRQVAAQIFAPEAFDEVPGEKPMPKGEKAPTAKSFELTSWNPWQETGGPAFPLDTLPAVVRHYVEERARLTGADASAFALAAIMAMSAVIDHRVKLQPKEHDHSYLVSPLLWGLLVGPPSTKKSAVMEIDRFLSALDARDASLRKFHVDTLVAGGMSLKDAEAATPPARRRLMRDTTTEALCSILGRQDSGIGLFRDEISGWIGAMDKYGGSGKGGAQDRSIWLVAWNGGFYIQHRLTGTRAVNNLSVSVLGSVQPDRLKSLGDLDADGLLQRFLPIMMSPAGDEEDMPGDPKAYSDFRSLLEKLDKLPIKTYRMGAKARVVRNRFASEMAKAARMTEPSPAFGSFMGKQERTLVALALILHLAKGLELEDEIGEDTALEAERICWFLIRHAYLFYLSLVAKHVAGMLGIAGALVKLAGQKITQMAVNQKCSASRGLDGREFRSILLPFQAAGWVIADDPSDFNNKHWWVNPDLANKFAKELGEHTKAMMDITRKVRGDQT